MDKAQLKHGLVVLALMAVLAVILPLQPDLRIIDSAGVSLDLPERVGDYVGQDIFFCQNEACLRSFGAEQLAGALKCPSCKGDLDRISLGEKRILPADTQIARKEYRNGFGDSIQVSVVQNGKEQKSIHRPQQCLPAQGHAIEASRVIRVNVPGRSALDVMFLDTRRSSGGKGSRAVLSSYAYWFAGGGHETPYHLQRLFWMSSDMLLRNVASRWAYVAVQTSRDSSSERHVQAISSFIAELHPLLVARPGSQ